MVRMRFSQNVYGYLTVFVKESYMSGWVCIAMQSVHIRMNSSLSPPPTKKILDPPMFPRICLYWQILSNASAGNCSLSNVSAGNCSLNRLKPRADPASEARGSDFSNVW